MAYNFPLNPQIDEVYSQGNRTWKWNGTQWVSQRTPTSSAAPVYFSTSPPPNLVVGSLWYNTLENKLSIWGFLNADPDYRWIDITSGLLDYDSPVFLSSVEPANAVDGMLWYDIDDRVLKIRVAGNWETSSEEINSVFTGIVAPGAPMSGTLWYNPSDETLYIWAQTGTNPFSWKAVANFSANSQEPVIIGVTAPPGPDFGTLWFNPQASKLFLWVETIGGPAWVEVSSPAPVISISESSPPDPVNGALWYDPGSKNLYIRDNTAATPEWVSLANPTNLTQTLISSVPPQNPYPGDLWFNPENGNFNIWYVDLDGGQWVSLVPYPQNTVTQEGGVFTGPIFAGYNIPDDPLAFVTVEWVEQYIADNGTNVPLSNLSDVDNSGLTNLSTLVYDSNSGMWQTNVTLPEITDGGFY
jgi:hypothetical protein